MPTVARRNGRIDCECDRDASSSPQSILRRTPVGSLLGSGRKRTYSKSISQPVSPTVAATSTVDGPTVASCRIPAASSRALTCGNRRSLSEGSGRLRNGASCSRRHFHGPFDKQRLQLGIKTDTIVSPVGKKRNVDVSSIPNCRQIILLGPFRMAHG